MGVWTGVGAPPPWADSAGGGGGGGRQEEAALAIEHLLASEESGWDQPGGPVFPQPRDPLVPGSGVGLDAVMAGLASIEEQTDAIRARLLGEDPAAAAAEKEAALGNGAGKGGKESVAVGVRRRAAAPHPPGEPAGGDRV